MKQLEYPYDSDYILRKKKAIRRELLAREDIKYIEKKIAILGGSTTSDIKQVLELFLLNYGIKPEFFESEYNKYFEAFGFTEKTGIDLPGEASPVYHTLNKMGITELASSSFGQTFNITPIQMISAVSAAVNGGNLVTPHLVKEIVDTEGNIVKFYDNNTKRQVISKETSATLRTLARPKSTASTAVIVASRLPVWPTISPLG